MFYQDIKNRAIHIVLPILIFVSALIINYYSSHLVLKGILLNVAFITINIVGLVVYFSIKNRAAINPIDKSIGLGDIVFFLAITPLFGLQSFILFFISGLIFSLLFQTIYNLFKKTETIPLAGYLSLFLIANVFAKTFFKINLLF